MYSIASASDIKQALALWYKKDHRDLPWRRTSSAYHIWLSEIILQQTRVDQGMDYYHRFIKAFPTVTDLASASEDEVLRLWQGLGYYSRGRNLLKAAQTIVRDHAGQLPRSPKELIKLPGIGPYTSAAILSFAYGQPYATVDGNVYRVISRLGGIDLAIDSTKGKKVFGHLAANLLDRTNPAIHNNAMMELGATLCTPTDPDCFRCPLSPYCVAYKLGTQTDYPRKSPKKPLKERFFHFFELIDPIRRLTVIGRRTSGDIWQGLYQPILVESSKGVLPQDIVDQAMRDGLLPFHGSALLGYTSPLIHLLTHRRIEGILYRVSVSFDSKYQPPEGYTLIPIQDLHLYARPKLVLKLTETSNTIL